MKKRKQEVSYMRIQSHGIQVKKGGNKGKERRN